MALSDAEKLRLLNLAYIQMQSDFQRIFPDLFRGATQSLTTDSSGVILLPTDVSEVELIVKQEDTVPIDRLAKSQMYRGTGWYHDGIDTSIGKQQITIRQKGSAYASLAVYVEVIVEYPELTSLASTPHPFAKQRYRNMLTELQTFMLHMEGGKESAKEAEKHWNAYQFMLSEVKKDSLDKFPEFMAVAHADAGDGNSLPIWSE